MSLPQSAAFRMSSVNTSIAIAASIATLWGGTATPSAVYLQ